MGTTDDLTYYKRHTPIKHKFIKDFVGENLEKINSIYDIGCNNGDISYPLQKEFDLNVYGIDLSNNLNVPKDYRFDERDIVKDNSIYFNDCTLFLSLYHHILGAYGLDVADDIFYKLLLRTKYLIFDTGNLSEKERSNVNWYKVQSKHFNTEDDLLNHFNIDYDVIGNWSVAGGSRKVVVFYSKSFDNNIVRINEYRRLKWSKNQCFGLFDCNDKNRDFHQKTVFFKLKQSDKIFFSKKQSLKDAENNELKNIIKVHNLIPEDKLVKFYGFSEKYGFIFEWLDDIKYMKKIGLDLGGHKLVDVDVIMVNDKEKYIDFER